MATYTPQERPPVDATEDYPRTRSHGRSSSTAYAPRSRGILSQTREFFMGPREAKGTSRIPDYREEDKLQHTGNLPPPRQEDVKDVRPVNTGQDVPSPREIGISQQINQKEADIKKMQMGTHGLLQRYRSHIHYLEQELAERDAEKEERYAQQLDERDLDIKQLSDSIIKLKKENRELESLVVRAQENALESMLKKTGWSPKEDPMVREEFSKMQMKLRAWAMNNGAITLDYLEKNIPNAEKDKIIRQLSGYCVQTDWQTLITKMSIPRNKIPVVLLQSMLARDIFEGLFADPFFAFTEMGDSDPVLPKSNELKNLYETMREVNEAEAHTWRSQTLRILSTTTNPNSESQLARRTRQLVGQRTASFLTSSASLLLRHASAHEHKEQCIQDLQALYRDAAELALALWTQRTFMRPYSLGGLEKFFVSDPRLLAHRLHHLDEDDTRLDGKNVLLVVQPLVVAFGNEDAENYDRSKIWCPATVVVDESSGPQK